MRRVVRVGVRIVFYEARVGARVALATGFGQLGRRHHGPRIRRGQDVVEAVAIPATRRLLIAQSRNLGVERIVIGGELLLVAASTSGRGLHLPVGAGYLSDLMRGMAVGAHRGVLGAGLNQLTVDAS